MMYGLLFRERFSTAMNILSNLEKLLYAELGIPMSGMGWSDKSGIGGRLTPELVVGMDRNDWSVYTGISGRITPEYASPCSIRVLQNYLSGSLSV